MIAGLQPGLPFCSMPHQYFPKPVYSLPVLWIIIIAEALIYFHSSYSWTAKGNVFSREVNSLRKTHGRARVRISTAKPFRAFKEAISCRSSASAATVMY